MKEYIELIKNNIISSYQEIMVIDILDDKLYKYQIKNNDVDFLEEESYMEYLSKCSEYIHEDDLNKYIDMLSINRLENEKNTSVSYKKKFDINGHFKDYLSMASLLEDNGKKIIIVLTLCINNNASYSGNNGIESILTSKLNKMTDSVSLAILKIHNIVNGEGELGGKREFLNSILANLTNEFPEFNKSLNETALFLENTLKSTILIIDDDKMTCNLIKKIFDKNYDVLMVHDGKEAIDLLSNRRENIACIFLDLIMPELDGFSVLDFLNDNNYLNKLPVIIISGNYDKETRNRAYSYQIADMLEKPFNVQVVRHRIENLINLYKSSNSLNDFLNNQHRDLKNIVNSLLVSYEMDNYKCIELIKKYVKKLAMQVSVMYPEYNINSNMIDKMSLASCYYAIGNYTMPKSLLYKKGVFTEEERKIITRSNINGASIVKYVVCKNRPNIDSDYCYEITRYYNERYDGLGYPEGLMGNSIPLSSQIASLAIEYMNLINTIVPVDYEKVASLIEMEAGKKFNPKIVEAFKKVKIDFEAITKVGE